jgi:murein L,D-transpeptidase YcbB/YkuD
MDYSWRALALTVAVLAGGQAPPQADLTWIRDGRPTRQAQAVLQALRSADAKGLNPEDYDASRWAGRLDQLRTKASGTDLELFDLDLTIAVMRYVSDLHTGRVNPGLFHHGFDEGREDYDPAKFIRTRLVNAVDVKAELGGVEPPFPGYGRTQLALQTYLQLAARAGTQRLAATKKPVEPGTPYAEATSIARLLRMLGDLPACAIVPDDVYQGALVDAVKHFQHRHGLDEDGRIGSATFRQLNAPLSQRVRQLQLTLERYRWVPHQFAVPPIVVNIPEFRLRAMNASYTTELEMKAVVGNAYRHQTPVFAEQMESVVFRPYWEVPLSIQRAEMVPKVSRDRSYLARNGYEVVSAANTVATRGAIDDSFLAQLRFGKLHIRQVPGPENALGLVKFLFPNPFNVYMHGTPAARLFAKSRRDFSHGCIRVERPEALAALVLRNKPEWTPARIAEAMHGTKTVTVRLETPIPVLIVYATAVVQENGDVHFYEDIYGHDAALEKALEHRYPYPELAP